MFKVTYQEYVGGTSFVKKEQITKSKFTLEAILAWCGQMGGTVRDVKVERVEKK